jgi:hypothetical protein
MQATRAKPRVSATVPTARLLRTSDNSTERCKSSQRLISLASRIWLPYAITLEILGHQVPNVVGAAAEYGLAE